MHPLPTILVSGKIGAGKTVAVDDLAQMLQADGRAVKILNLDKVGHRVLRESQEVRELLKRHFGEDIFEKSGTISRGKLSEKAFASTESVTLLNAVTHPAIAQSAQDEITAFRRENPHGTVIIESPFPLSYLQDDALFTPLLEGAIAIAIAADEDVRRARKGSLSLEEFNLRNSLQGPSSAYTEGVDCSIDNSADRETLRSALARWKGEQEK